MSSERQITGSAFWQPMLAQTGGLWPEHGRTARTIVFVPTASMRSATHPRHACNVFCEALRTGCTTETQALTSADGHVSPMGTALIDLSGRSICRLQKQKSPPNFPHDHGKPQA